MKVKSKLIYIGNRLLRYFINLKILNNDESIKKIIMTDKSLARYGDGEMSIILGGYINFQRYDKNLSKRLREILSSDDSEIEIGIPLSVKNTNGYTKKAKEFWNQNMDTGRFHWKRLCSNKRVYCNASMTRLFIDYEDKTNSVKWFKEFKKIWEGRSILIIEGNGNELGVNNDLFSNAKDIKRIIAPSKDAYDRYEDILKAAEVLGKDKLVLVSLGPTATVLAYDLCKKGIRTIDIGHIQLEYNQFYQYVSRKKIEYFYNNSVISKKQYNEQIRLIIQ